MMMEAENLYDTPFAGWRPRRTGGIFEIPPVFESSLKAEPKDQWCRFFHSG